MRLFAISDLHADYRTNRALIDQVPADVYQGDVLIVAGDISHDLAIVDSVLAGLRRKFGAVFFVPGNHELWVNQGEGDSVDKFHRVIDLCDRLGVQTRPQCIGGLWIVPLFSWYHSSFDDEPHPSDQSLRSFWSDFERCRWPGGGQEPSDIFLKMNQKHLVAYDAPVVSISHFLPRRELMPNRKNLRFPGLLQVVGCRALDAQICGVGAFLHVFGHSHIPCDMRTNGVRYVQKPLAYPRQRERYDYVLSELPLPVIFENGEML